MPSSHGRSIGQYYLTRDSFGNEPLWLDEMQEYMEVDNATDTNTWETLFIRWGARTVTSYSVSLPNFAYVVHSVAMSNMPRPRMKHRDIIVDNYRAAGGNLATFQRIGVSFINNTSAYDCIEAAFAARGLQFPDLGSMVINLVRTPFSSLQLSVSHLTSCTTVNIYLVSTKARIALTATI